MSSIYTHGAIESMFDAEQTAAKLLDAVKANVAKTVKTVDAAVSLENKLSEEAAQFNACLTTMSNSIRKCERGEISREEMLAECAPCVSTLKEKCVALKLANVEAKGTDITEEEIAMLKEYIVGCKDIVADHKKELQDGEVEEKGASEGILSALSDYEPATEAANTIMEIRRSNEAKTARDLYVQAKKLYGLGSKDKAREYLKKSQKLYEQCLEKVKKHAKVFTVERTTKNKYYDSSISDTYKREVTENMSAVYAIEYFEDRIDSCKALDLQWTNKAGKLNYSETKAQLKAERKAVRKEKRLNDARERIGKKAAKDASKSAKKYADAAYKEKIANATTEEEVEAIESIFETMYATESFAIETLSEYDLTQALEAEGDEAEVETGVSENEQKLRELYEQFNEAKAANDADKMDQLTGEINSVLDKIAKEAGDAYTEEDLKTADRKLAKGLAIGAAVVAAGAAIGVGIKAGTFKKIAETAKAQAGKLRSKKGEDKGETKKGEGALNSLKTAIAGLKGKFKKAQTTEPSTDSLIDGMTYAEFEATMESLMDTYELELAMESAMESEGEEIEEAPKSASGLGARLRKAFGKLKKSKENGNEQDAAVAFEEITEAAEDLEDAAENAETPEQKKKLSKAAKIGIAAAATAAAAVGAVVIATKAKKTSEGPNVEPEKAASLMKQAAAAIKKAKKKVNKGAIIAKHEFDKFGKKIKKSFKKGNESFLADLAFGLESVCAEGDDVDPDEVDTEEGKAFDDNDLIEEANESELEDLAVEAAIAVMLAEDGIDDSDIE